MKCHDKIYLPKYSKSFYERYLKISQFRRYRVELWLAFPVIVITTYIVKDNLFVCVSNCYNVIKLSR